MNLETKVGAFVVLGLGILGLGIVRLSDVKFGNYYTLYFLFQDVQDLRTKSQVKIAGVEIGQVEKLELDERRARVTVKINGKIPIYANAKVRVKLIGLIGSQFLDVDPGTPDAARLKDGDTLIGVKAKSMQDLVEKLSELLEGKDGMPGIGDDLKATMTNLRSITGSLNYAIGQQRDELREMVQNLNQFTVDLKGMAADMHELTSSKKQDIEVAITKLRSTLERVDDILARVQRGEGSVGKLLADREMGEEVKKTVSNLKDTSESAKQVLNRFTKFRSFWEFQLRSAPQADTFRADGGIRLQPRDGKYYYLGVNNVGDRKDEYKNANDYEKKNTITALLGKEFGPVTVELGAIRSTGGIGLKYYPFDRMERSKSEEEAEAIEGRRQMRYPLELNAQAFDFGRDETRGRAGQERAFKGPLYNVGVKFGVSRYLRVGASVEDLAETKQYNIQTHFVFEDRDLAYLFGFVSFAR